MTHPNTPSRNPSGIGWTCSALLTPRDAASLRRFNAWNIGLALSFVGSLLLLTSTSVPATLGYVLAVLTLGIGLGTIRSYVLFLREADELLRKIHLEAIAVAFGAGLVSIFTWELLEQVGAPKVKITVFAAAMLITWGIAQALGVRRYSEGEN